MVRENLTNNMLKLLFIVSLLVFAYMLYVLIKPEKF